MSGGLKIRLARRPAVEPKDGPTVRGAAASQVPAGEGADVARPGATQARLDHPGTMERMLYALGGNPRRYILTVALPLAVVGSLMAVLLPIILAGFVGAWVATFVGLVGGVLVASLGLLMPLQRASARGMAIDHQMHVFITHLGVLATTPMARVDLFATVASKKEYGPLAEECAKITSLAKSWHLSLPGACRFIAARTPSHILGDFLERLAHALEAGDALEEFLENEQSVVMHQYQSMYERRLNELAGYRDLFSSMMMGATFLAVFTLMMPLLSGMDAGGLLPGVLLVTGGIMFSLVAMVWTKAPRDPLWHKLPERSLEERRAFHLLLLCIGLALVGGVAALALRLPAGLAVAIGATPLALPALSIRRVEALVRRRDDNYPAFVRSLGAGVVTRGGAPHEAVEKLQRHNYGPLTPLLRSLHRRLSLKLLGALSWRLFAVESGSHLIHTFNSMFLEGTREGGNGMKIGGIISQNVSTILSLRKQRLQVAASLRGMLFGMAGAVAFTLYLNLGVLTLLTGIFTGSSLTQAIDILPGLGKFQQDLGLVSLFVAVVMIAYAAAASATVCIVDGGRPQGALLDFAAMLWASVVTSYAVEHIASGLL